MQRASLVQRTIAAVKNSISGFTRNYLGMGDQLNLRGFYTNVEHLDKDGKLIKSYSFHNDITNEGAGQILDIMFDSATQITAWYIGLISSASYSALAAADVMNSHGGWTEFTAYSESVRQTWGAGASSSRTTTNASAATFSINGTGTVKGIFVASNSTKSGTTGKLWATGLFSADVPVNNGDSLKVTYSVSC